MTIGEYIKEYRKNHSLSQRQFAAICKFSNGYISMLERNINPKTNEPIVPSISLLKAIATATNITLGELLNILDDMPVDLSEEIAISKSYKELTSASLTESELALINAYRAHPEMQDAVNKLLGIPSEPARSDEADKPSIADDIISELQSKKVTAQK